MHPRVALLALALATLLPTSCQGPTLVIAAIEQQSVTPWGGGRELVGYRVTLANRGAHDVAGAWAAVAGPVAGVTIVRSALVFGPTAAGGTSPAIRSLLVLRNVGAPFDPGSLVWLVSGNLDSDQDADGLTDYEEADRELAYDDPDVDGDGVEDGAEVLLGSDPSYGFERPSSFPPTIFYAMGQRRDGEPALALTEMALPLRPAFLGRPGPGITSPAFDRHGFLYAVRGDTLVRLDPFSGAVERTLPLLRATGAPAPVSAIAFDLATNQLHGAARDLATGAPGTEHVRIDPATGLVSPAGAPALPAGPSFLAFDPALDPEHGRRSLHLLSDEPEGGSSLHVLVLPDGGSRRDPFSGQGAGVAFDAAGMRVLSRHPEPASTELYGGSTLSGEFPFALEGLAIPPACPAPCFGEPWFGPDALRIETGDLDGDGDADAVTWMDDTEVFVLRNDGPGQLANEETVSFPSRIQHVLLARLDGDAALDLAALAFDGSLFLAAGDGSGGFGTVLPVSWSSGEVLAAGDVTGDGAADLVTADQVLVNDGSGSFTPFAVDFGPHVPTLALAHVDGDGLLDAIAIDDTPLARWAVSFASDGAGGFTELSRLPLDLWVSGLAVGDLDADGLGDALVMGGSDEEGPQLLLLRGTGNGLAAPERMPVPESGYSTPPVIGDVTGDGHADVVSFAPYPIDAPVVLVGDGGGGLRPSLFSGPPSAGAPLEIELADLDGDGSRDLLLAAGGLVVVPITTD